MGYSELVSHFQRQCGQTAFATYFRWQEHAHVTFALKGLGESNTVLCVTLGSHGSDQKLGFHKQVTGKKSKKKKRSTFQMMAEHGVPCDGQDAAYCMNGGTCYKLASMETISCVCNDYYKGSRCEQFQLLIGASEKEQAGLIVALVLVALLILVVFAVIVYFTYKMLKAKQQRKQSHIEYWKVKPRV